MKTYGKLRFLNDHWVIEAQPHVALKLRRVFPRIGKAQQGIISIRATTESARDLEWFCQRYPLEVWDAETQEVMVKLASKHKEAELLVDRFNSGQAEPRDFPLALPPRDYQRIAAELALATGGLLVADDVGLGKTATSICMLSDSRTLPALVVTMTHLPAQWEREFRKFAPWLRTHIVKKGTPYDVTYRKRRRGGGYINVFPDVLIINYHKLNGWAETLAPVIRAVVYDEVQELRHGSDTFKGAAAYLLSRNAEFRLGLSATPIHNYGGEFFAVMEAIRPGALGSWKEFENEWLTYGKSVKDTRAFGVHLRESGLMIRRTRADVGRELPPVSRIVHSVECDLAGLNNIADAARSLAKLILSEEKQERGAKFRASEELSHMLRHATGVAKAPYVAEFVRMLVENDQQVLLFGWHHDVYRIWRERLVQYNPMFYTGSESTRQKANSLTEFIEGRSRVLIMSLRAGAGVDGLQHVCSTPVFGELDWSPAVHEQDEGRIARDGQKNPVQSYFLVTDHGSDPVIREVLGLKSEQIDFVRDPNAELIEKLEVDEKHIKRLAQAYLNKSKPSGSAVYSLSERRLRPRK